MNEKSKKVWCTILYFVLYFALGLLTQLPGFASPYYWVCFPIITAFFVSGPLTMCIQKTDSVLLIPVAWFFVYRAMGEVEMPLMQIGMLGLLTAAVILSVIFAKNLKLKTRVCVPVVTAMYGCYLWPLYFQKDLFLTTALGSGQAVEYVNGLRNCSHIWVWVLVTAAAAGVSILSERLTEKLFIKK